MLAFLNQVRPTTWQVLALAIAACLVASWLVNFVVGASSWRRSA